MYLIASLFVFFITFFFWFAVLQKKKKKEDWMLANKIINEGNIRSYSHIPSKISLSASSKKIKFTDK